MGCSPVSVLPVGPDRLEQYWSIPIAFQTRSVFDVETPSGGLGGIILNERKLKRPLDKDYDAIRDADEPAGPTGWPKRFDVRNWVFLMAFARDEPVGGATVAFRTPGVDMLEGRDDLAVLWDLRVRPDRRRDGIGTRLFRRAAAWSRENGCRQLKVETQNTNAPACRFYARMGCTLGAINRHAYIDCPSVAGESMLLWYLDLD